MSDDLLRRALEVNWQNLALGHEVFAADGGTFVRNLSFPAIYDANFIYAVTASTPKEIERVLARAKNEYAHAAKITFRLDPLTPPPFEAQLVLEGYERRESLVLLLEGNISGDSKPVEIRRIHDEVGWQAFRDLKRAD